MGQTGRSLIVWDLYRFSTGYGYLSNLREDGIRQLLAALVMFVFFIA